MARTRKAVLDAVVCALSPMLIGSGGHARRIALEEIEKPDDLLPKLPLPSLAVFFVSSARKPGPYLAYNEEITFRVTALTRHGISPGPLELLEGVRPLLIGKDLGVGAVDLNLIREAPEPVQEGFACASADYSLTRQVSLT